jgi:uncharacterized membrane protein
MWNLTSYDINRIKGQLQARRARIEAKYADETKALDADFADLETLERVAAGLALKYKADEPASAPEESSETTTDESSQIEAEAAPEAPAEGQLAATSGEANGPDAKFGSRWRLALRDRPVVSEAE